MKLQKPKIICVHLLNDFSGSPLVFSNGIKGLISNGHNIELHTSNTEGFLSGIENVQYKTFKYNWSKYKIITLLNLMVSQLRLFIRLIFNINKQDIIYINTILPFGASIAGKIKGCKVVYHIHETSITPQIFKSFLFFIIKMTANKVIYVSNFLRDEEPIGGVEQVTIYNTLSEDFVLKSNGFVKTKNLRFNVLMLCSLKEYKGVFDFLELAYQSPDFDFTLILNAQQTQINMFFDNRELPVNLKLYPAQKNVHPFYQKADVVLNLSNPEGWIETFGMTALEAMSYGVPVICPTVGGIAELVENGYNGFKVDVRNKRMLKDAIVQLSSEVEKYNELSKNAKNYSQDFNYEIFVSKIYSLF